MFSSLDANYCIQVLSTDRSNQDFIVNEAKSINYTQFSNVRVESRGRYLVFRIGDYRDYNDALGDISAVRRAQKDAYIRKCDLVREKIIYMKDDRQPAYDPYQSYQKEVYTPPAPVYKQERQPVQKKQYTPPAPTYSQPATVVPDPIPVKKVQQQKPIEVKPKYVKTQELVYPSGSSKESLWDECKKCFTPMYEEEQSPQYTQKKVQKKESAPVMRSNEIEVRVSDNKEDSKDSFWSEDVTRKSNSHIRKQNKYNINEQFLP